MHCARCELIDISQQVFPFLMLGTSWVLNRARGEIIPPGYCSRGGVHSPPTLDHQLGPHVEILLLALRVATELSTRVFQFALEATFPGSLSWGQVLGPTAEFLVPALLAVRSSSRATCFVARDV